MLLLQNLEKPVRELRIANGHSLVPNAILSAMRPRRTDLIRNMRIVWLLDKHSHALLLFRSLSSEKKIAVVHLLWIQTATMVTWKASSLIRKWLILLILIYV